MMGSYDAFSDGLKSPYRNYTSSYIDDAEPPLKRSRIERSVEELELNFSDDEVEVIDPNGYMCNLSRKQHPSAGVKSSILMTSSLYSTFSQFLSSDKNSPTFYKKEFNNHTNNQKGRNHYCPLCQKSFIRKRTLTSHLFVHFNPEEKAKVREGLKHECYFCQHKFKTPYHLHRHLVIHIRETPFRCHNCRRQFTQNDALARHMQSHNPEVRRQTFRCEKCGKCFTTKYNLTTHEKTVHLRLKDVQCSKCDKKFSLKKNLQAHINGVHLGIRHPCSHCRKTFSQKGDARKHEKNAHP